MEETNNIKIFLADDHKILRESLELLLSQEDDFTVIGQAENWKAVLSKSSRMCC